MPDLPQQIIRFADLRQRGATTFDLAISDNARAAVKAELDLLGLRKLSFRGELRPAGATDWTLAARLGATVDQPCVVTLETVTTRIDEDVSRSYVADFELPDSGEVEMPEDDTTEPLPDRLDLAAVMIEALSLALPPFPRAEGAALGQLQVAEPGIAPMTDEDAKPFAGLSGLRDALQAKSDEDDEPKG